MAYTKTNWLDRAVQHPNRFTLVDNGDGTYTLTPAPGTVTQTGTPLSATNLNKMEQGIADALPKSGGEMTGPIRSVYNIPFISKSEGYKSFTIHHPAANSLIIVPSASVDGEDWEWSKQFIINADGTMTIAGNIIWNAGNINPVSKNGGDYITGNFGVTPSGTSPGNWSYQFIFQYRDNGNVVRNGALQAGGDGRLMWSPTGGEGDYVWTSTQLRINNGVPEFLINGEWRPAGGMKSIQRFSVAPQGGSETPVNITIGAVNPNKAYIVLNSIAVTGPSSGDGPNTLQSAVLTSATNVECVNNSYTAALKFTVVESY